MESGNASSISLSISRLKNLEYAIRKSMTVREDMDEDADPVHIQEAKRCGIGSIGSATKGDLLNAVQTTLRAAERDGG